MGTFSVWHWLVVLVVVLVLFGGGGKLSRLMGDAARGITAFRKGLKEETPAGKPAPEALDAASGETVSEAAEKDETART